MQIVTDAAASWAATSPEDRGRFRAATPKAHSGFWRAGAELLAALPESRTRNPEQARTAATVLRTGRESREAFMMHHAEDLYAALTRNRTVFVRAEALVYEAAKLVPGLVPTRERGRGRDAR